MSWLKSVLIYAGVLLAGILIGAYAFSSAQPRSVLALNPCADCLNPAQLLGLLTSAGIKLAPGAIPLIVKETDKSVAIKYPFSGTRYHFVILPKKDIKDPADIRPEDAAYVTDMFGVVADLVKKYNMHTYRVEISGPGYQTVNYLHFHLISDESLSAK